MKFSTTFSVSVSNRESAPGYASSRNVSLNKKHFSRMRTVGCMPPLSRMSPCHACSHHAFPLPCPPPAMHAPCHTCPPCHAPPAMHTHLPCTPPGQNDRRLWKHYLSATTVYLYLLLSVFTANTEHVSLVIEWNKPGALSVASGAPVYQNNLADKTISTCR